MQAQAILSDTCTTASSNGQTATASSTADVTGSRYAVTSAAAPYTVLHATATLAQLLGVSTDELHSKGLLSVLQCTEGGAVEGAQELQLALQQVRTPHQCTTTTTSHIVPGEETSVKVHVSMC
jgi:hypothetical protein